ncbi:MAG: peptidoglycan editing factor PgeF [Maritimibacter sp.]
MTLEILTSDALAGVQHGFFTRRGGASSGVYAGLNCGAGSDDQTAAVRLNKERVAAAMEVAPDALVTLHQTHSPRVVTVHEPFSETPPEADAMVTNTPGLALGILTADCEPVLFADQKAGVVGAAHAGWKGALDGVLEATVDAMVALGAQRSAITAVVGPTISQGAYEVGPEFMERFLDCDMELGRFFAGGRGDRVHFDLPAFGVHRLREAGVGHAEWTRHCTYQDADRFYSFRRSVHKKEADYGRLISVIRL